MVARSQTSRAALPAEASVVVVAAPLGAAADIAAVWAAVSMLLGGRPFPGGGGGSFDAGTNQTLVTDLWIGFGQVVISAVFAGTPGKATCHGQTVSALALQYGGLGDAAVALGYSSVGALQNAISVYCAGDSTHQ